MSVMSELFAKDKTLFESFGPSEWIEYYTSLNEEVPVKDVRLKLTENEKKCYNDSLTRLKTERKNNPNIPIEYEIRYSHVE